MTEFQQNPNALSPVPIESPNIVTDVTTSPVTTSPVTITEPIIDVPTSPNLDPPTIPIEMVQPDPARLIVHDPPPIIPIQPASPVTKKPLPPLTKKLLPPLTKKPLTEKTVYVQTEPVTLQPVQPKPLTLTDYIVKGEHEDGDYFEIRKIYTILAPKIFPINITTALLIGRMAANKTMYGMVYPDESDAVIDYIIKTVSADPERYK
jgi:hypothetical protein